jgi:O-succinylbenzoate synthase
MNCRFAFRCYQRPFQQPLRTRYGDWKVREGIIVQLNSGAEQIGLGEIAPVPWFGSETLEQALDFCQQLPTEIDSETIFSIPTELPACQFGFESAWEVLNNPLTDSESLQQISYSALLPAGTAALMQWRSLWDRGYRTFKWKIGVASFLDELQIFNNLLKDLPPEAKLRLDANGGLSWTVANQWLEHCDKVAAPQIEFLEQPLPVEQFEGMRQLNQDYETSLALDESVATLAQLQACYQQAWQGIFVVKPAIAGSPKQLRQFCQQHPLDLVMSSVFETSVGKQAGLKLAVELSSRDRAVGYGVDHWIVEDLRRMAQ